MAEIAEKTIEQHVLDSLSHMTNPMDLDRLVELVLDADEDLRPVDVKIAALDLVSRGRVKLNEAWQLLGPRV